MINMKELYGYFKIGLKMGSVTLVLSIIYLIISPSFMANISEQIYGLIYGSIPLNLFIILALFLYALFNITLIGYISNKIWGWR